MIIQDDLILQWNGRLATPVCSLWNTASDSRACERYVVSAMKFLFVHQNFPGQFLHLLRHLVKQARHEVLFITEANPNHIPGVRKLAYAVRPPSSRTHFDAADFEAAMRRAAAVAELAAKLRDAGFDPDVIIGHEGWGEMLNLGDVWPRAPRIGYREYFYHLDGADVGFDPEFPTPPALRARIRAKNAVDLLALLGLDPGVTPTLWQRSLYPGWAQPAIAVAPDGVDLDRCRPDIMARARPFCLGRIRVMPGERLVTYVARDLEPYRGFHVFMRALPAILAARPDAQVVCLGGDGVSYGLPPSHGTWRGRLCAELGGALDPARVHFPGRVPFADLVRMLQRSDVHAYLSYPFIPSWSLREALACGCTVVTGDTAAIAEFVQDRVTGALTPALDPAALADRVLGLLDDEDERMRLGEGARRFAEAGMRLDIHLAGYEAVIRSAMRQ